MTVTYYIGLAAVSIALVAQTIRAESLERRADRLLMDLIRVTSETGRSPLDLLTWRERRWPK